MKPVLVSLLVILTFIPTDAIAANCPSGNLYVDFDGGSDSAVGTSTETAWKHSPGDTNASGNANCTLVPGNTVNFKSGVKYRGSPNPTVSGEAGNPITYKGLSTWGSGNATITGADVLDVEWTQCVSSAACWNNANYASMWTATIPPGTTFFNRLFKDGQFLWFATSPNPTSKIAWQEYTDWYPIPLGSETKSISNTHITDPDVFTQSDSSYWDNAYVAVWVTGNSIALSKITDLNATTDTITISLSTAPYTDRTDYYVILNHPSLIDEEGEYAFSSDGKIYLYSTSDPNLSDLEIGSRKIVMNGNGNYITIDNMHITGAYGTLSDPGGYGGIGLYLGGSTNIKVQDTNVDWLSCMVNNAGIRILADNARVQNCRVSNLYANRGIHFSGDNSTAYNNEVFNISYTGIYFLGSSDSTMDSNYVHDIASAHGNGMSVYAGSNNCVIKNNKVYNMRSMFTFESSDNLTIFNNVFDGNGIGKVFQNGREVGGYVRFYNNTLINKDTTATAGILSFLSDGGCTYDVRNNIIDGGGLSEDGYGTHENNIYVSLGWWQSVVYDWSFGSNEVEANEEDVITSNYVPIGVALDSGANLSTYFTTDILGTPRGTTWDIGAYEYNTGAILNSHRGRVTGNLTGSVR